MIESHTKHLALDELNVIDYCTAQIDEAQSAVPEFAVNELHTRKIGIRKITVDEFTLLVLALLEAGGIDPIESLLVKVLHIH